MSQAPPPSPRPGSSRRGAFLLGGIAVVGLLVGVRWYQGDACCAGHDGARDVARAEPAASVTSASATLPPGQSFDEAFAGCQASCGSRSPEMRAAARPQPGAVLGEVVHCPVSGAVFRIKEDAVRREVLGKPVYFCCASCAAYFDAHRAEILSARGIPSGGA